MLPDLRRRRLVAVGRALVEVVGDHPPLVGDHHLLADDDRVIPQEPLGRHRRRGGPIDHAPASRVEAEVARLGDGLEVDPPLERADIDRPRRHLRPRRRPGERRPAAVGLRGDRELVGPEGLGDDLRQRPGPAGEGPFGRGIGLGERLHVGLRRRVVADRGAAEELLGRDPRQVDRRVGMRHPPADRRTVGDELAIGRQRLGELPLLKRQVADQVERIVAPRRAERLLDDPAEQAAVTARLPLLEPSLGLRVDPVAIEGARLGRQGGDPPLAIEPGVDEERRILGRDVPPSAGAPPPRAVRTGRGRPCRRTAGSPADRSRSPRRTGRPARGCRRCGAGPRPWATCRDRP